MPILLSEFYEYSIPVFPRGCNSNDFGKYMASKKMSANSSCCASSTCASCPAQRHPRSHSAWESSIREAPIPAAFPQISTVPFPEPGKRPMAWALSGRNSGGFQQYLRSGGNGCLCRLHLANVPLRQSHVPGKLHPCCRRLFRQLQPSGFVKPPQPQHNRRRVDQARAAYAFCLCFADYMQFKPLAGFVNFHAFDGTLFASHAAADISPLKGGACCR